MDGRHLLDDVLLELRKYKRLAERALAQVPDEAFLSAPAGSNSPAIVMKHMAGNMRSRWTDFLTSDGEKPDRHRDLEFELEPGDDRAAIEARWEAGWAACLAAIETLEPEDLANSVTIRGEPHTVVEAIHRQMTHYAYHVGQLVLLARLAAGDGWQWLSIPPGKSAELDVTKEGQQYLAAPPGEGER